MTAKQEGRLLLSELEQAENKHRRELAEARLDRAKYLARLDDILAEATAAEREMGWPKSGPASMVFRRLHNIKLLAETHRPQRPKQLARGTCEFDEDLTPVETLRGKRGLDGGR